MIVIENGPKHSTLIRALDSGEEWIDFQIDLLVRRRPEWALEAAVRLHGSRPELLLRLDGVSSLETVDYPDHYDCSTGYAHLQAIVKSLLAAQDALIEPDQVLLKPEHVFLDPVSGQVKLAIIPVLQKPTPGFHFDQDFRSLLASLQKAYKLDPGFVEGLSERSAWLELAAIDYALDDYQQLETARGKVNTSDITLTVGPAGDQPDVNENPGEEFRAGSGGGTRQKRRLKKAEKPDLMLLFLVTSHSLIAVSVFVLLSISYFGPAPVFKSISGQQLSWIFYPVVGGMAVLLLVFDLILAGVFHRITSLMTSCVQVIGQWILSMFPVKNRAAGSISGHSSDRFADSAKTDASRARQIPSSDPANQTVLLASLHENYRLGLLSVGLPGSPEEMDGLRAYILVDEFLVGRDDMYCDLPLPVPSVGRRHARISRREGSFFITDLGSKNGTSLDGRRLNKLEEYLLPDRCRLEFADQAFYFSAD
ncbi:MAG: hypothetical protein H6Q62_530 [Firmicutes bacterium]|nr:hypothetical protein [Bacillota bacterium]